MFIVKKKKPMSKNGKKKVKIMKIPPPRGSLYSHTGEKSVYIYVNTELSIQSYNGVKNMGF